MNDDVDDVHVDLDMVNGDVLLSIRTDDGEPVVVVVDSLEARLLALRLELAATQVELESSRQPVARRAECDG